MPKSDDAVAAIKGGMGIREAGRRFGIDRRTLQRRLEKERTTAGFAASGVSTLYDANGEVRAQWVKESAQKRSPEQWAEHVREALKNCKPLPAIRKPRVASNHLFTVFPIGDHHTALYAHAAEAGADYDIKIATKLLTGAARILVDKAPASSRCLVANVGDFFHTDNFKNETPASGNKLDADTRYGVMIKSGVAMLRTFIECALEKFETVEVENACGNHDPVGALWLSLALALLYENNPRVKVNQSPAKFHYYQHGKVLLGITHGDLRKIEALPGIMATDQPEMWGATRHRYWFTGHVHHRRVIEGAGCMIESFRTLAARDAWATAEGYRSGRDMTSVTFHEEHGEVMRQRCDVSMLE